MSSIEEEIAKIKAQNQRNIDTYAEKFPAVKNFTSAQFMTYNSFYGYLFDEVKRGNPQSVAELKAEAITAIDKMPPRELAGFRATPAEVEEVRDTYKAAANTMLRGVSDAEVKNFSNYIKNDVRSVGMSMGPNDGQEAAPVGVIEVMTPIETTSAMAEGMRKHMKVDISVNLKALMEAKNHPLGSQAPSGEKAKPEDSNLLKSVPKPENTR